jgi:hypothetical protein
MHATTVAIDLAKSAVQLAASGGTMRSRGVSSVGICMWLVRRVGVGYT